MPVINGLTDLSHPCQAHDRLLHRWENFGGELKGRKLAYVGDGNNMAHSLMFGAPKWAWTSPWPRRAATRPNAEVVAQAQADARGGGHEGASSRPRSTKRSRDADIVETDVWASMGQEAEAEKRRRDFARLDGRRAR